MAVVYRAYDLQLDRQVALKVLDPVLAEDADFRQRFIRESRSAAAVDHPNIIPVFAAGEADGVLFIAMRYVSGPDVRTLIDAGGPLPARRAVDIVAQVAAALDTAHERGLVHRDVKPANMLLDPAPGGGRTDHAYLSDFGLSKQALTSLGLTATGQLVGTLDYVAPEQIENRPVDGRGDLYSLACTAFEMLCGTPPFRRDQHLALLWAQLSEPPPPLTSRRPDLPPAVDRVMAKALAKSPGDRYARCLDFADALRAACLGGPGEAAGPDPGERDPADEAGTAPVFSGPGYGSPGYGEDGPYGEAGGGPRTDPAAPAWAQPPSAPGPGPGPAPTCPSRRARRLACPIPRGRPPIPRARPLPCFPGTRARRCPSGTSPPRLAPRPSPPPACRSTPSPAPRSPPSPGLRPTPRPARTQIPARSRPPARPRARLPGPQASPRPAVPGPGGAPAWWPPWSPWSSWA